MKHKFTNGMLFISVVLLGAFIWFFERNAESSHLKDARNQTVFTVYPQSITSISLERGEVQIACSKASGTWRMTRPVDAPVDTGIIEKMISNMTRVKRGELISTQTLKDRGLSAADYGFAEPRARITFTNNRGTFTWLIGRDAPLGDKLYLMQEGSGEIIAASRTLLALVPENPAWIRDRALFREEVAAINGIDLLRPGGFLQLRQSESHGWLMQQPHKSRATILSVHDLLEKILSVRAFEFVTDEKSDLTVYGLEKALYEVSLSTKEKQVRSLKVGKPNPDLPETHYAKWADQDSVFTVPAQWIQHLDLDADQLRNRHILGVLPARISTLQITHNEQQTQLVQTNGQWQITRPVLWDTEPSQVREMLESLARAVAIDFVDRPSDEQKQQVENAEWILSFSEENNAHTLRISAETPEGLRLIQRDDETSLYTAKANFINPAISNPLFFRGRTVLQIDPSQIDKITQATGSEQYVVKTVDGAFLSVDRMLRADAEAIFNLTTQLMSLRATHYVAFNPESLTAYGLDEPACRLTVSLTGTDSLGRVLLLGKETAGGRFAMLQGQPIVFVLANEPAQALIRRITTPLEEKIKETE